MEINLIWDSSTSNAPTSFRSAVQQAADILSTTILNNITVNIQVGVDSIGGQPMDATAAGVAYPTSFYANYSQTVSQLSHAAIQNGGLSLASVLPAADPSAGNFDISNAEAKAFGMINPNASGIDGVTGFSSTIFTDGFSDMVDVALHELAHALGRVNGYNSAGITWYYPLDLYTYSAPGILWNPVNTSTPGYFSLNAGLTNLGNFSTSDVSDFLISNDAFGSVENGMATLTSLDKSVLQALGFLLDAAPSTTDTVSAFLAQYSANKGMAPVKLADTAANIVANLDALQSDLNGIFWISQTDTVPIGITEAQFSSDSGALGLLQGSVSLQVSGVAAADVQSVLGNSRVASISVSDSSANLSGYLDILQSNIGNISSISITDNAGLAIWWTQYVNDAGALALIQGNYTFYEVDNVPSADASAVLANSHGVSWISVSDNAANLAANLDSLQSHLGNIFQIAQTDTGPLAITAAQYASDQSALSMLGFYALDVSGVAASNVAALLSDNHVLSIAVADTLVEVASNYGTLSQNLGEISGITLTDAAPITLSVALLTLASPLIDKIVNSPLITIADTASHLSDYSLSMISGQHVGIDLTAMDADALVSGGLVSQLDLSGLAGASYTVKFVGPNTVVDITTNGALHTLTLQGETPAQLAIVAREGSLSAATFSTPLSQAITSSGTDCLTVQYPGTTDTLYGVQRLHFTDASVAYDLGATQSAGQAAELIGAAYGISSLSDMTLVGKTIALFDGGSSMQLAAQTLLNGLSFASDSAFVSTVWQNLVGTPIDSANLALFTSDIATGAISRAALLALAAQTVANQNHIDLVGLALHGLDYLPT